jgi:hypothetical protein
MYTGFLPSLSCFRYHVVAVLLTIVALLTAACPSTEPTDKAPPTGAASGAPAVDAAEAPAAEPTTPPAPPEGELGTLAARIEELKAGSEISDDVAQAMADELAKLRQQDISATAISAGQSAPGFALANQAGEQFSLATALADGPVVLLFFRGAW